jgi:hypothetical protein
VKKASGSSILIVLCVMATLSACISVALSLTGSVSRNVQRSNQLRQAVEIGDGVIDFTFAHWREKCRPQPNAQVTTVSGHSRISRHDRRRSELHSFEF